MNLGKRDLKKMRWHLAAFLTLLAMATLIARQTHDLERQSASQKSAASHRHRQVELRLQQVRIEEQEIRDKSAIFLQLMNSGVIGEERRLEWTELLRDLQRQLRLPDMSYEFAPQAPLGSGADADYNFYTSSMKLQLKLLHEEDLTHFLAALQRNAKAMILVRRCSLTRQEAGGYLGAECEIDWATARGPIAGERAR